MVEGTEKVSAGKTAARVGISHGLIYHYFPDIPSICFALFQYTQNRRQHYLKKHHHHVLEMPLLHFLVSLTLSNLYATRSWKNKTEQVSELQNSRFPD
ncbi:MAG: TetR/AcrR family transcriptional regulator [Proteobacteria bacterium]|nr:TetR/AcrR family transcriptional regulator [Pseudomonadota bacterium]